LHARGAGDLDHLDRRDEAVALARDCFKERRSIRRLPQRLSNFTDCSVDAGLDVDEDVFGPQVVDDVAARYELAPPPDQEDQKIHRLASQLDRTAQTPERIGGLIELEVPKSQRFARA